MTKLQNFCAWIKSEKPDYFTMCNASFKAGFSDNDSKIVTCAIETINIISKTIVNNVLSLDNLHTYEIVLQHDKFCHYILGLEALVNSEPK